MRSAFLSLAAFGALLFFAADATAHGEKTATVEITATTETEARVTVRAPLRASLEVTAKGCTLTPSGALANLHCPAGLAGTPVEVIGWSSEVDLAVVQMSIGTAEDSAVLTARNAQTLLPGAQSRSAVLVRHVQLGIEHVLSGFDHVLFLLALFWQALLKANGSRRKAIFELARTATGFTLAHSLTLTGTVLGWLRVPSSAAEACIALSLVLAALDISRASPTQRSRFALASAFGLVHGLGFAGALMEAGLPAHDMGMALLGFNAGVEVGQGLLLASAFALVIAVGRVISFSERRLDRTASVFAYGVGITGVVAFLSRASALFDR